VRILFVSPRQCWPSRSGAKLRDYHFAQALGDQFEMTYMYFADPGSDPLTRNDLPFCHEIIAIPKPAPYGARQILGGLIGRWPLPVLNYTSTEMAAAIQSLASRKKYSLIHFDTFQLVRYWDSIPGSARNNAIVHNWHNIESEAMWRFSENVPSRAKGWYARQTARKMERLEKKMLQDGWGHIVCSDREREQLLRAVPAARIAVVENGVDTAYFAQVAEGSTDHSSVVFVGTMDYHPNIDAALSFARETWPEIHNAFPNFNLKIVGANPVPAVRALGEAPGITVTGTVPDVRPYYQDALAAVVPLRTGGGTRLKILEAMAAGVPVISTPLGAEGLAAVPDKEILFAAPDQPQEWVQHLRLLTQGDSRRDAIVEDAGRLVRSRYDWARLGAQLVGTYREWLGLNS
jgi:glycosyltransferase involved in cell wall biosynthesis